MLKSWKMWRKCLLTLTLWGYAWSAELFVFFPSYAKPAQIEKELSKSLHFTQIVVFARYSDFAAMFKKKQPDAVIAPMRTLQALGLSKHIIARGIISGETSDKLVLVSQKTKATENSLQEKSVGMVAILNRKGMNSLLHEVLSDSVKLNLVTKLEDLLPMLIFNSAQSVLVTQTQAKIFQKKTKASLQITLLNMPIENVAFAVLSDTGQSLSDAIVDLPDSALRILDLEGWER